VSRPPVTEDRQALTPSGHVRYTLKTPYRDGTTHIVLEPLELMARLAALVPSPRMHLTRYHGVFAPHSKLRAAVTPAYRGAGLARQGLSAAGSGSPWHPLPGRWFEIPMPPASALRRRAARCAPAGQRCRNRGWGQVSYFP
jgi:hypothetical protein